MLTKLKRTTDEQSKNFNRECKKGANRHRNSTGHNK